MREITELGYINKETILKYVTEIEVFQLVFDYPIVEHEYVTSPFREDKNPGCWFEFDYVDNKLKFRDFLIGNRPLDCFDAVQRFFNLPNFYKTLEFVKKKLIDKKIEEGVKLEKLTLPQQQNKKKKTLIKKKTEISISTKHFNHADKKYWQRFGISKENLIEDKVFSVNKYIIKNPSKGGMSIVTPNSICYAYTDFDSGRKKVYQPYNKKYKFFGNCVPNDIGGINLLVPFGDQLVITKSYKDYRVLKNCGLNVVWFQNEGMIPDKQILKSLCQKFNKIVIFFDNDEQGLVAAKKLLEIMREISPYKARIVHIPIEFLDKGIKDPANIRETYGQNSLKKFLKKHKLIKL